MNNIHNQLQQYIHQHFLQSDKIKQKIKNKKKLKNNLFTSQLSSEFLIECDYLIVETDINFISSDMQIILSLRSNDLKSLLPEVTVRLVELKLIGTLSLNISLTDDYPFIGDTQV